MIDQWPTECPACGAPLTEDGACAWTRANLERMCEMLRPVYERILAEANDNRVT